MQRRRRTPVELSSSTPIDNQTDSKISLSRRGRRRSSQSGELSASEVILTQKTPSSFRSKLRDAAQWLSGKFKRKNCCVTYERLRSWTRLLVFSLCGCCLFF